MAERKSNADICTVCEKPKIASFSALMLPETSRDRYCGCEALSKASSANEAFQTIRICKRCSKKIQEGRQGSFTQWIFRKDLCACDKPQIEFAESAKAPAANSQSASRTNEVEIVVNNKGFPLADFMPLKLIAQGGAGHVYKCRSRHLGHLVAIKVLRRLTSENLIELQQEARIVSKLSHENILKIFDLGMSQNEYPYMVMEYLDGLPLKSYLRRNGPLDVREALPIFVQICDGLSHAHERGVYHRDLSSANIMIVESSTKGITAKLIDFGLSLNVDPEQQHVTRQGLTIVGTAAYMSPDQIAGKRFDSRSEVYSFGCLMFEVLTGTPPFEGETPMEVLSKHAELPPPKLNDSPLNKTFAPELCNIVEKCLRKDKTERYQSFKSLKEDLMTVMPSELANPAEAVQISSKPRYNYRKLVLLTGIALGATTIALAAGFNTFADYEPEQVAEWSRNCLPLLDFLSKRNNDRATVILAEQYLKDDVGKRDPHRAFNLFMISAQHGNLSSAFKVAHCYYQGTGVPRNPAEGHKWLVKAAQAGYARAATQLSLVSNNSTERAKWLKTAIAAKEPLALCIGAASLTPIDIQDFGAAMVFSPISWTDERIPHSEEFVRLLKYSAEMGVAEAQFNIGLLTEKGVGLRADNQEAQRWYRKAAEQGDQDAQYRLGHLLECSGETKNFKEMISWYKRASRQGNKDALLALSRCSRLGKGTARDTIAAERYVALMQTRENELNSFKQTDFIHRVLKPKLRPPTFSFHNPTRLSAQEWRSYGAVTDDDLIQIQTLPGSFDLTLFEAKITGSGLAYLKDTGVQELRLDPKFLKDSAFDELSKFAIPALSISSLTDQEWKVLSPENFRKLKSSGIQEISLTCRKFRDGTELLNAICEIKSIKSLRFGFANSSNPYSLESIRSLSNLEELTFTVNEFDDHTVELINGFKKLRLLRLNVLSPDVTDVSLLKFAQIRQPELKLTFQSSKITDAGVTKLAALPNVTVLSVLESVVSEKYLKDFDAKYRFKTLNRERPLRNDAGLMTLGSTRMKQADAERRMAAYEMMLDNE